MEADLDREARCKYCQGRPRWADGERFCFSTDWQGFPRKKDLWDFSFLFPLFVLLSANITRVVLKVSKTASVQGPESGQILSQWVCGK